MRIWTMSLKNPVKIETFQKLYDTIVVPNNITYFIDIRTKPKTDHIDLSPHKLKELLKSKKIGYLYIGDKFIDMPKSPSRDQIIKLMETNLRIENMIVVIAKGCEKYNLCIIGDESKLKKDLRYELCFFIKDKVKEMFNETLYIMHIGA